MPKVVLERKKRDDFSISSISMQKQFAIFFVQWHNLLTSSWAKKKKKKKQSACVKLFVTEK